MNWLLGKGSTWLCALGLTAWGAAMFGILQIHQFAGDWGHGLCGPWGCTAPMQALASYHGFWFVLLLPPACLYCSLASIRHVRRLGLVATTLGVLGLCVVMGYQFVSWYPRVSGAAREYWGQRLLFSIADLVDVPLVQIAIVGVTCLTLAHVRRRQAERLNAAKSAAEPSVEQNSLSTASLEPASAKTDG